MTERPGDEQLALPLAPPSALGPTASPEATLAARLIRLGLAPATRVTLTRNQTLLLSWHPRAGLRLHAGYAWAPDDVLAAIVIFLKRRIPRTERLAARRHFMAFPVTSHVASRARRRRAAHRERPEHLPLIERLTRLHQILNERHFAGSLNTIPIRISDRMRSRLGELRASRDGSPLEIAISERHIRRDGWTAATETLLHEMVHQWQVENRHPLDHGRAFRDKAKAVGISPRAKVEGRKP